MVTGGHGNGEMALVLDFGSQYSHLIARRCREAGVYSELIRGDSSLEVVKGYSPSAVVLSGGPFSVFEDGAPSLGDGVLEWLKNEKMPTLGICYGMQLLMHLSNGGVVEASADRREYGAAFLTPTATTSTSAADGTADLFEGVSYPAKVWMSHGDKVKHLADGYESCCSSETCAFAAVKARELPFWGLQFHPEVAHTVDGQTVIRNFLHKVARLRGSWNVETLATDEVARLRNLIGDRQVIGAVSGGVDSTVAAALVHRAIGDRFHPFLIDTGLLRKNEAAQVVERLARVLPGINLKVVDASDAFLDSIAGIADPETKRKKIGAAFVDEFVKEANKIQKTGCSPPTASTTSSSANEDAAAELEKGSDCAGGDMMKDFMLLQGTLYPDVIESRCFKGPSHTIKTHHNVGGLPDKLPLEVVEPLKELFKDEVRQLGLAMNLGKESIWRHPFPGPGLAIRILGEVTRERVSILQMADDIFISELRKTGHYERIGQAFAVLLPDAKSVGVMGDKRTYEMTVALRAVSTTDYMTADWYVLPHEVMSVCATRIVNEVNGVNRVVYDITSKPPGTIEWE